MKIEKRKGWSQSLGLVLVLLVVILGGFLILALPKNSSSNNIVVNSAIQPIVLKADITPSSTQGTIVQSKGCQATSGTSNNCQFTASNIVALNTIIACAGSMANIGFNVPTDTLLNTYRLITSRVNTATTICWEADSSSGGSDTITYTTSSPSTNTGFCQWELNGVMTLDTLSASGGTTSATPATSSLVFIQHPVFLAIISSTSTQGTFTNGANFVTLATGNTDINCQSSISGLTTPTTFPATLQNSVIWSETGAAIQAQTDIALPIILNANNNYTFTAEISETVSSAATLQFAVHTLPVGMTLNALCEIALTTAATGYQNACLNPVTTNTSITGSITATNGLATIYGQLDTGSTSGSLSIDFANIAQVGTLTVKHGSSVIISVSQ